MSSRANKEPEVYNLSWYNPQPATKEKPAPGVRTNTHTISKQEFNAAIILYPALATPEILVGETGKLEILLLTRYSHDPGMLRFMIASQLKISAGLDPKKGFTTRPLFFDATWKEIGTPQDRKIEVSEVPFFDGKLVSSGRFSGYVDTRVFNIYSTEGYRTLYKVTMSSKVLEAAMGASELYAAGEPQDRMINKLLLKRSSWAERKEDEKFYCFADGGDDVDHSSFDYENPIQSYHPVFHYRESDLRYANFAHISDVHLAARQQVLARTVARVIDFWDKGDDADLSGHHHSPPVGSMVNICSKNMWEILTGLSEADILLIGGDLVDCLRSCYLTRKTAKDDQFHAGLPWRIWQEVALDDNYTDRYKDAADMIAFFGVLLKYCRENRMPAYAITGNHDCYHLPYGISPRIDLRVTERRANEGIPSDHNLTFYEALLAFGETYSELKSGLHSPFDKDMFDWFYMVFTPFSDFSIELPEQNLVALGWGNAENIFDVTGNGQGFGHLPRSTDGISDEQFAMLKAAIGQKNVILMTHFTFVSYDYPLPVNEGETSPGFVYLSWAKNYGKYNSGAFEQNREHVLKDHCYKEDNKQTDIQIVLTGHSHRRALYLFTELGTDWARQVLRTHHYDFEWFERAPKPLTATAIIVSDSGGTIPRYNFGREFNGRGSDPASGTKIAFDPGTGALAGVSAARAHRCRPRIAVAVDYLDIQEKQKVLVKFASKPFKCEDEKCRNLTELVFEIKVIDDLENRGFWIESLAFFGIWSKSLQDQAKIVLKPLQGSSAAKDGVYTFAITNSADILTFSNKFAAQRANTNFLSLKFGEPKGISKELYHLDRYDFDSPWCWEFQVDSNPDPYEPDDKIYTILRDPERAEKPNFDTRRANRPGLYTHQKK